MGTASTKFNKKTTAIEAADNIDLNGKVVLVTGCNTGIGKETVRVLAIQGAKVFMLCRNKEKADTAREELIKSIQAANKDFDGSKLIVMSIDLSSLLSVRRFVGRYLALNERIDYLINNAGIMAIPEFQASADGYELTFAVNHLGHFYLTLLLTPLLQQCAPCRVINVASAAHSYSPKIDTANNFIMEGIKKEEGPIFYPGTVMKGMTSYGLSKVCVILFAREYNRRYGEGIRCVSLHPGAIATELYRNVGSVSRFFVGVASVFMKNVEQGAATTVRCVSLSDDTICGGCYYKDCNEANEALRSDIKANRGKVSKKKVEEAVTVKKEDEKTEPDDAVEDKSGDKKEDVGDDKKENVADDKEEDVAAVVVAEAVVANVTDDVADAPVVEAEAEDVVKQEVKEEKEEVVKQEEEEVEVKQEVKEEVKEEEEVGEDVDCAEYKLWEWSELLIKVKGFNLDMIGFEQEEKERLEKEEKEAKEEEDRLEKEEKERVEKEKAAAMAVEAEEKEDVGDDEEVAVDDKQEKEKVVKEEEAPKAKEVEEAEKEKAKQVVE